MELYGDNQRINHYEAEHQTGWSFSSDRETVTIANFSKTGDRKHNRLWDKMCQVLICAAVLETVSLGYAVVPQSIARYSQPFVSVQAASDGRFVRMNDIQKWRMHKLGLSTVNGYVSVLEGCMEVSHEAAAYLDENNMLVAVLTEANSKIEEYFPERTLYLEVLDDPEENVKRLMLSIGMSLEPEIALNKLYELDHDWWLTLSPEVRDKVCIDLVFV